MPESLTTRVLWQSAAYTVYADGVIQNSYYARTLSATQLTASYCNPAAAEALADWQKSLPAV